MDVPFQFDVVHLPPREQIGLHTQDKWELSYVLTGEGERLIGDTTEAFVSGDMVLVPPGIPHCWYFSPEVTDTRGRIANITIVFSDSVLDGLPALFPSLSDAITVIRSRREAVSFKGKLSKEIAGILLRMRELKDPERIPWFIELLLLLSRSDGQTSAGSFQKLSREETRLSQIHTWVICNADRKVSVGEIAAHVGMNKSAFCTFFRKATGKTFVEYLNEYRIETACELLEKGGMSISEACYRAGFGDIPYFNRLFRRLKGCSPSEYVSANSR